MSSLRYDYDKQRRQSKRRRQLFMANAARIQKLRGQTNLNNLLFSRTLNEMIDNGASPQHVASKLEELASVELQHANHRIYTEERHATATIMVELSKTNTVESSNSRATPLKRLRMSPRQNFFYNLRKAPDIHPHLIQSPKQQQEDQPQQEGPVLRNSGYSYPMPMWTFADDDDDDDDDDDLEFGLIGYDG